MKKVIKSINNNLDKIIIIVISVLILNLLFYIFVGSKAIINSDSTFIVDYSIEQIETKSIFPTTWVNSNDFWIYSLIPIITPLIRMGVSLFASRQIAVLLQTLAFFLLLYDFYKKVFNDKKGMIIMTLMFLSGVSGQFMYEMYGDATYGTIVFYMLLALWLFIKYVKSDFKKTKYLVLFDILLGLLTCFSMRFPIYIGAPIICCIFYFCYEKGINKKQVISFISICFAILVGFLINKYLQSALTFIDNYEYANIIDGSDYFIENVSKSVFDYFFICGATGKNIYSLTLHLNNDFIVSSSSPLVVLNFIKYIYAIVTIIIPFKLIKKFKDMTNIEKTLYIYVSSYIVIMIFFLIFGDLAWWHRYMFAMIFTLNLLYPMFYKYFFEKDKKMNCLFKVVLTLFLTASVIFSTSSYINFKNNYIRRNDYQNLSKFLIDRGYTFGYALNTGETNLFRTITNGKLQVVRLNNSGTNLEMWLTSTRYYEKDYYKGKTFFIRNEEEDHVPLEKLAENSYNVGSFTIYTFKSNDEVLDFIKSPTTTYEIEPTKEETKNEKK